MDPEAPPEAEPVSKTAEMPTTILEHKKLNEWLGLQKREQNIALETARSLKNLSDEQDPELLNESIQKLRKRLMEASSMQATKKLMVKRMQLGTELLKYLYPHAVHADGAGDAPVVDNEKQRTIKLLLEEQTAFVTDVLEKQKVLKEKKAQLAELRSKNRDIQVSNRERMHEIKEKKESLLGKELDRKPEVQTAKQRVSMAMDKVTIARHLFQGLISASQINWAKDPELSDLMIELGEMPKFD